MIQITKLDWSKCTYPPFDHQIEGTQKFILNKYFANFDEMGAGKTKQVIDAAGFLYEGGELDAVLIICPAQVKDVWIHPTYSQIIEHSFVPGIIHEFTSSTKVLPQCVNRLLWIVVSVELLRNLERVNFLLTLLKGKKFWAVVDESSTISNPKASQTRGVMKIKPKAARRSILNGTPQGNTPLTLYSQMDFVDTGILGFRNFFAFRNHHCVMGGFMGKQVIRFEKIEEIQAKIKPYCVRRLKVDCLDILPKMKAPIIEVRLSKTTWAKYTSMREEFVAYLSDSEEEASIVTTAPVKALRLAQICSGFLGGFHDPDTEEMTTIEIGSELTDAWLDYYEYRLKLDQNYKLITWCRFRPEIARLERKVRERFPNVHVSVLRGGLSKTDREEAKSLFHPDAPDPSGPALLIGQPQAGRFGLNFTKCSNADYLSNDHSFLTRSQSEDRIHRPGQRFQALFQDYVVVGPDRERTASGLILKALRERENMAAWTCSKWITEIMEEDPDVPF